MKSRNHKIKSTIAMTLALFMVVSMLSVVSPVLAAGNATLSLVPSTPINLTYPSTLPIGSTFTVQVNVADVQNLWGVNFGMTWNPAIVHVTKVQKGNFLTSNGDADASPATTIDNVAGTFPGGFSDVLLTSGSVSGSGTLATITFQVDGFGSGDITITSAKLLDPSTNHAEMLIDTTIPYSVPMNNPTPPPSAPTAAFTASATPATVSGTYITIPSSATSTSIVLDASSSTAGFDGLHSVAVNGWSWTIHSVGGKFADITETTQTVTLNNVVADDLAVSLTVTASESNPPAGYVSTNQISRTYSVLQQAASGIDVITQQGGTGPNAPSGPFGPQQNIVTTATVIFNGAPVAQKDVVISVFTNNGTQYAYQTARTNGTGQCTVSFRLPTPDTKLDQMFGRNWTIIASVDVSEVIYTDSCKFEFNYLANIAAITVAPGTVIRGTGQITIDATISNITNVQGAVVTFTVVDVNNVPIAAATVSPALTGSTAVEQTLSIPNYAFCGQAKIYVNVLSGYPAASPAGVPYCPQNGAVVTFDSNGNFVSSIQNQPAQFIISY